MSSGVPEIDISVLLTLPGEVAAIRKTLRHLSAQTAWDRMELVLVTSSANQHNLEMGLIEGFRFSKLVILDTMPTGADGWAAAARAASGRILVLAEDHSYPEANWAERLIAAHDGDWAVVSPLVQNGNPATLTSCASFLMCFVEWFGVRESRVLRRGAGHNSSYKKHILLGLGGGLVDGLRSEAALHDQLSAQGHRMYLEAGTSTCHLNISLSGAFFRHAFLGGKIFGDMRSLSWPLWKRCIYAAAFGLVPPIRLLRIYRQLGNASNRKQSRFYSSIPILFTGLFCHALGEAIGSLCGAGNAFAEYGDFEMRRIKYVLSVERKLLLEPSDLAAQRG